MTAAKGDALDPDGLAELDKEHDAVVSAYSPGADPTKVVDVARAHIAALP